MKKTPTHKVKPRQYQAQILVFATLIIGIFGTFSLKYFNAPLAALVLFPGLVLVFYALLASLSKEHSIEPEIVGDNCYYFGFIFTLVSMAYTLYGIYSTPDNLDLVAGIVSGFGVALSSTIVGITLRVIFLQLRPDLVQSEQDARRTLNSSVNEFKTEISTCLRVLKSFHTEAAQQMIEFRQTTFQESKDSTEQLTKWLEEHLRSSTEAHLQELKNRSNEEQKIIKEAFELSTLSFKDSVDSFGTSAETLDKNARALADKLRISGDRVGKQLDEMVNLYSNQASEMMQVTTNVSAMGDTYSKSMERQASELNHSTDKLHQSIASTKEKIDQLSLHSESLVNSKNRINNDEVKKERRRSGFFKR